MNDLTQIFYMLIVFEIKKIICDYPIHPTFILKYFYDHSYKAFLINSCVHAFGTLMICMLMTSAELPLSITLAFLDFVSDLLLSAYRAKSDFIAKFKPLDLEEFLNSTSKDRFKHRVYWGLYGLDRMARQLMIFLIVYLLCEAGVVWIM